MCTRVSIILEYDGIVYKWFCIGTKNLVLVSYVQLRYHGERMGWYVLCDT